MHGKSKELYHLAYKLKQHSPLSRNSDEAPQLCLHHHQQLRPSSCKSSFQLLAYLVDSLNFFSKRVNISEISVNRCKSDICNLIEFLQAFHKHFTNLIRSRLQTMFRL